MTRTDTARRLARQNTPADEIKKNLTLFIDKVLNPIRERYGSP